MTKTEMKADILKLFSTPLVMAELPETAEVNRALAQTILERAKSDPGTQHSNLGGWQSTWDMESWGGAPLKKILTAARSLADSMTVSRNGTPAKVKWRINCWANINRSGKANEFHTHPGAFWSGSYYVDDGGSGEDPALGGAFEVQDPRGVAPAMYAPMLTFAGPGGTSVGASYTLQPHSGMIILFPSWLQHAVRPYRGQRMRISIAFNLSL